MGLLQSQLRAPQLLILHLELGTIHMQFVQQTQRVLQRQHSDGGRVAESRLFLGLAADVRRRFIRAGWILHGRLSREGWARTVPR